MKIFLVGFSSEMHTKVAFQLKNSGNDIQYWIPKELSGEFFSEIRKKFPTTVFHEYLDALNGNWPEEIESSQFPPISKKLAFDLLDVESKALLMIERIEYSPTTLGQKKHLYYEQVRYWYGLMKQLKPDAVVFSDAPHTFYNFVLSSVAKYLGIKTIYYRRTKGTVGHLNFFTDYLDYSKIRNAYLEAKKNNVVLSDLSSDLQEYYLKQTNTQVDSTPFYRKGDLKVDKSKNTKVLPSANTVVKKLREKNFFITLKNYFWFLLHVRRMDTIGNQYFPVWKIKFMQRKWKKQTQQWRSVYESKVTKVDFDAKYVYVPMHFQPECATNPFGDIYDDQILMVDTLAQSIPSDWVIYVKENPIQWSWPQARSGRFDGYYDLLLKNKNVRLVSTDISTFELIEHSQVVAAVTGTALWESILRSKPVCMFGSEWFMDCEGVFQISGVESCQNAILEIQKGFQIDKSNIIAFLYALEQSTYPGYVNLHLKGPFSFTEDQNVHSIVHGILDSLKN